MTHSNMVSLLKNGRVREKRKKIKIERFKKKMTKTGKFGWSSDWSRRKKKEENFKPSLMILKQI